VTSHPGRRPSATDQTQPHHDAPSNSEPARRLSRRVLLVSAAGVAGLAVGAGGTAAGYELTASSDPRAGSTIPPSEDLMREHGVLKRLLLVYREASRRINAGQPLPAHPVHQAATMIHDYIEGFHEGLEEAYVFPRLQRAGRLTQTVRILLVQHARGRRLTTAILAATQPDGEAAVTANRPLGTNLAAFVRMYEPHEAREDTVVFPTFRSITPPKTFTDLGEHFVELETKQFGKKAFGNMVERVSRIEQSFGIDNLAQFTPSV
jgi:hemerythrin-like domain-containing protein